MKTMTIHSGEKMGVEEDIKTKIQSAQRSMHYRLERFSTERLQKHGLAYVTIKPKITGAVVAKIHNLTQGKVYYKEYQDSFTADETEYSSLAYDIEKTIRQRAIELVDQLITSTGNLAKEYEIVVDLDERTENMLQKIYTAFMIEKELRSIYNREVLPKLEITLSHGFTGMNRVGDELRKAIERLTELDNIEEAKKQFTELARKLVEENMMQYIEWLKEKIRELDRENTRLREELKKHRPETETKESEDEEEEE